MYQARIPYNTASTQSMNIPFANVNSSVENLRLLHEIPSRVSSNSDILSAENVNALGTRIEARNLFVAISPSYVPKKMYRGIKDENSMIGAAIEANLLLEKIDATKKQKLISATPNVMKKNHIKEGSVCLNTFESTIVQLIAMNRKITK